MKPHPHLPAAFAEFGLQPALLQAIEKAGFETPSDIQREMIPMAMQGKDILGQARTGTGKTAAFALPLLYQLDEDRPLQALILVPTRELAVQVTAEIRRLSSFTQIRAVPVYGGQAIKHQVKLLGRKTQIIVATPGRILDLLNRRIVDISDLRHVILDEVDRMLDIGFIDDIRNLLSRVDHKHQTIFVSATLSDDIKRLAQQFMTDPQEVNVSEDELTVEKIHQLYCSVEPWDKYRLLHMIIQKEDPPLAIVFTNTKHAARKLAKKLFSQGVDVKEIHGDLVQSKRERVMERFRRHKLKVLVATDLAARGIDVQDISHIINYDIPKDPQIYVHRVGRTARMGAFGRAISFVTSEEGPLLTAIEMLINKQVESFVVDGFKPSAPREKPPEAPKRAPRLQGNVFKTNDPAGNEEPKTQVRKTLGSKFRPRRRR